MKPTRTSVLLAVFVVFAAAGGLGLRAAYDSLPELPSSWVVTVAIAAIVVAFLAWTTRNRLTGQHGARPPEPLTVARYVALARACSPVGAGLTGAWFGALIFLLTQRGMVDAVAHDRRVSIAGIVSGVALTAAGLWLEWVCRLRVGSDDHTDHR